MKTNKGLRTGPGRRSGLNSGNRRHQTNGRRSSTFDSIVSIERIRITDYRTCLDTSFRPNEHLSVLIGPNGSGKTNILRALLLLRQLVQPERTYERVRDAPTAKSRLRVTFRVGQHRAALDARMRIYTDEHNQDRVVVSEQRWVLDPKSRRSLNVPLFVVAHRPYGSGQSHGIYPHQQYLFRMEMSRHYLSSIPRQLWLRLQYIAGFVEGLKYYAASQFTDPGSCPVSFEIEEGETFVGSRDRTRGNALFLRDLYGSFRARKKNSYGDFEEIVGPRGLHLVDKISFVEIPTSSLSYAVRVGGTIREERRAKRLIVPRLRLGKQVLSPNQLSEGTFRTLTLLFYLCTDTGRLLLLEEPEVCVHHGLLASVLALIKSHARRKQIVLSSHSEFVLDHVGPENVYAVSNSRRNGTLVKGINVSLSRRDLTALREYLSAEGNLGEYWRHGGFEP